jgi:hypothetical protein
MQQFIDTIIAEHRESRASGDDNDEEEDLLDVLLRLQKEVDSQYPLTTENIKTVMLVISSDFLININNILILLLLNLETNSFTGHVWRRQRDVGDDAAVGDGGADAKPKSDAEGPGRGPASPRRPRQGDRG